MKLQYWLLLLVHWGYALSETGQKSFDKMFAKWLKNPKIHPAEDWDLWQQKYLSKMQKDPDFERWESTQAFAAWKRLLQNYSQDRQKLNWALGALARFSPQRVLPTYRVQTMTYEPWLWTTQDSADYRTMKLYSVRRKHKDSLSWGWELGDWALGEQKVLWVDTAYGPHRIYPDWNLPKCAFAGQDLELNWIQSPAREIQLDGLELQGSRRLSASGPPWKFQLDSSAGLHSLQWRGVELGSLKVFDRNVPLLPFDHRPILWSMYSLFPHSVDSLLGSCQIQAWSLKDWSEIAQRGWNEKLSLAESGARLKDFLDLSLAQKDGAWVSSSLGVSWLSQAENMERVLRSHRHPPKYNALLLASLWRLGYWNTHLYAELMSLYELRDALEIRALGELSLVFMQLKDTRRAKLLLDQIPKHQGRSSAASDKLNCPKLEWWYLYQSGLKWDRLGECLGYTSTEWEALSQMEKSRAYFKRALQK